MKKRLREILIVVLILLLAFSLFMVLRQLYDYHEGDKIYSEAIQIAGVRQPEAETVTESVIGTDTETESESETEAVTETENKPESESEAEIETEYQTDVPQISFEEMIVSVDLDALRIYNDDVVGWIAVPNYCIYYPIVQGSDNEYYLNHTWNKRQNSVGSIFMEHLVSADFKDFNTIIYGHRMGNGTMFNSLAYYANYFYWKENPSIYIVTDDGVKRYDVYSTYEAEVDSITYALEITERDDKQKFIQHTLDSSVLDTGIVPTEEDFILTLSTCTKSGNTDTRWVVHAVLCPDEVAD